MPDNQSKNGFDIRDEMMNNSKVFKNFNQEFIVTTVDKVKLCLIKHKQSLKAQIQWVAPLGIFIALLTALLTSSFNNTVLGQEPEVWKSLFLISTVGSFVWFIYELIKTIKINRKGEGKIENIIIELKKSTNKNEADDIDTSDSNGVFFQQ